jgi:hypothetical protein
MKKTMPVTNQFSPAEKIALFLPLLRVLEEVSRKTSRPLARSDTAFAGMF